jgi:hypothetical protein
LDGQWGLIRWQQDWEGGEGGGHSLAAGKARPLERQWVVCMCCTFDWGRAEGSCGGPGVRAVMLASQGGCLILPHWSYDSDCWWWRRGACSNVADSHIP